MRSWGAAFGTESFRGHAGLRAWVAALDEGMEGLVVLIDEARITGEGVVLMRSHGHNRSRLTQMELLTPVFWQEIRFRDGLIYGVMQINEPPAGWEEAPIT
jgi:hypothetical protein